MKLVERKISKGRASRPGAVFLLVAIMFASSGLSAQDIANGATVFKKCAPCHAVGKGAKRKIGPALNGVVGRQAARTLDYKYSKPLKESGIVWDEATLAAFLRDSKSVIKSTRMKFAGLKNDKDIADVIAYLKQFSPDGTLK